jgi:hypothetical protein
MRLFVATLLLATFGMHAVADDSAPALHFRLDEGRNINSFTREGDAAAHLVLRSGADPRILVAFPAGNSGVGLWFAPTDEPVEWTLNGSPRAVSLADARGRPFHGIEAVVEVSTPALRIDRAVLSSVRVLRDFERLRSAPDEILTSPQLDGPRLVWTRDRLDGGAEYRLIVEALGDATVSTDGISSSSGAPLRLKVTALTSEQPLTAFAGSSLLTARAAADTRSRNVLAFLSYRDKFLAGSWRFNTYFGRDTLMSLLLLAPALRSDAIGSGIGSVLERLGPSGEVAHEEDIGELAVLRNAQEGRGRIAAPIYDYGMVDDDFMLAPLAARWLLDGGVARRRAAAYLETRQPSGALTGEALTRNFEWVVNRTAAFAADPVPTKLVRIKAGRRTGNWRDSEEGLGGGVFPYDINVALVPAALEAIDRLTRSGLLDPYVSSERRRALAQAGTQRTIWATRAPAFFEIGISADAARAAVATYAAEVGVGNAPALASLPNDRLELNALSLDESGTQVPVLHSDDGFLLLLGRPTPEQLERAIGALSRPFPAGLLTPVGVLVANPVFAGADVRARFSSSDYHGTVVWSWQQAMMAAGLDRQLERSDLSADLRSRLLDARARLWSAIGAAGELQSSELWSWSFANGCYRAEPFGVRRADVDESNAAQLWSTVFLAIAPPASLRTPRANRAVAIGACGAAAALRTPPR